MPDTEDEVAVKEWFSENVHSELVNIFSGVDDGEKLQRMFWPYCILYHTHL